MFCRLWFSSRLSFLSLSIKSIPLLSSSNRAKIKIQPNSINPPIYNSWTYSWHVFKFSTRSIFYMNSSKLLIKTTRLIFCYLSLSLSLCRKKQKGKNKFVDFYTHFFFIREILQTITDSKISFHLNIKIFYPFYVYAEWIVYASMVAKCK